MIAFYPNDGTFMGGFLERFRARHLNLDRVKSSSGEFENTMGFGFPVSKVWLLPRFLFKQCLTDGASAMQIYYDPDNKSYHMLYGLPHGGFTWYDMVPAPTEVMRSMVNLLRRQSGLGAMRSEATLKYIHLGRLC